MQNIEFISEGNILTRDEFINFVIINNICKFYFNLHIFMKSSKTTKVELDVMVLLNLLTKFENVNLFNVQINRLKKTVVFFQIE